MNPRVKFNNPEGRSYNRNPVFMDPLKE